MQPITVHIHNQPAGELFYENEKRQYGFNYLNQESPISLVMPHRKSTYLWSYYLHPVFDMNLPEGYLYELFKSFLSKEYGYLDDFLIFSHLCSNIEGRLTYTGSVNKTDFLTLDLDEVLNNDSVESFDRIVSMFLHKNAISGIQPKSLAFLKDKESINSKEYIVKTWGNEFPHLAENEYFCLKAIQKAGIKIPNIKLSRNARFLVVERFNYDTINSQFYGFEEVLGLVGKNRNEKYSGSYEQVAKVIYSLSTNKLEDMKSFFKLIVMNYLLRNGDAHLKNFGILYTGDFSKIFFAPAYDVVNTIAYLQKDKPALMMFGKKTWFGRNQLEKFGVQHCKLSKNEATHLFEICKQALIESIDDLENYIKKNTPFSAVGKKIISSWQTSLTEKTYKEIPSADS